MSTEYLQSLKDLETEAKDDGAPVTGTAHVHLDHPTGKASQLASGCIYGIPDRPGQIPDHVYRDIGFRYGRGGGSQLPETRGWYRSRADYDARFESAVSNYQTCRRYGAEFVLLLPALWGADGGQASDAPYPGDDGDWSSWDDMLKACFGGIRARNMQEGLVVDIWNEPDLHFFWNRSREQWLEVWERTFKLLRSEFPHLRVSGPCFSTAPRVTDLWWIDFLSFAKRTETLPEQWSWHMEQGEGDMATAMTHFNDLLSKHNIVPTSTPEININEYGTWSEQVPSGSSWFIAQLERHNAFGLRGNWAIAGALHDLLAGIVSKPGVSAGKYSETATGYYGTAEFELYKYYGSQMLGERVSTAPTDAGDGDVFAVVGEDKVRILAGSRVAKGSWAVDVHGLSSVGLSRDAMLNVDVFEFVGTESHFSEGEPPRKLGSLKVEAKGDVVHLPIDQQDTRSAFAFEINRA